MVFRIFIVFILLGFAVLVAAEEKNPVENISTAPWVVLTPADIQRVIVDESFEEDGLIAEDIPSGGDPLKLSHYDEDLAEFKKSRFTPGVDELLTATPTMTPAVELTKNAYTPKPTFSVSRTATATLTCTPTSRETPRIH